jgi:hypothetical protein
VAEARLRGQGRVRVIRVEVLLYSAGHIGMALTEQSMPLNIKTLKPGAPDNDTPLKQN